MVIVAMEYMRIRPVIVAMEYIRGYDTLLKIQLRIPVEGKVLENCIEECICDGCNTGDIVSEQNRRILEFTMNIRSLVWDSKRKRMLVYDTESSIFALQWSGKDYRAKARKMIVQKC